MGTPSARCSGHTAQSSIHRLPASLKGIGMALFSTSCAIATSRLQCGQAMKHDSLCYNDEEEREVPRDDYGIAQPNQHLCRALFVAFKAFGRMVDEQGLGPGAEMGYQT